MGKLLKKHFASCLQCWRSRSLFLHNPIPEGRNGRSTWLKCGYCNFYSACYTKSCIIYPCGGWDLLSSDECDCAHLDRLGNVLKIDERCIILPRKQPTSGLYEADLYFMQSVTDVRLDNFFMTGIVDFRGIQNGLSGIPDYYGSVDISDVIATRAFRKLHSIARNFTAHTRPKLLALRSRQPLAEYLHWSELKRLSRVNAAINRIILLEACSSMALTNQLCSGVGPSI